MLAPSVSSKVPGSLEDGSVSDLVPEARGFVAEFDRLAQRLPTAAESEAAQKLSGGCSVWAAGLRPEAACHLALSLCQANGWSVLFLSPERDLLEHRQLRLRTRSPCQMLEKVTVRGEGGQAYFATPDRLDPAKLARAFGAAGPDLVVLENAHVTSETCYAYRPSQKALKTLLAAFKTSRILASAPARGQAQMAEIGKLLGLSAFTQKRLREQAYVEETLLPPDFALRIEAEESSVLAQIVGPLPRPALVFCSTPAQADTVYARLVAEQVPVHRYHAGLPESERARELLHFTLPGRRAVMVAVSGFGPASGFAGEPTKGLSEGFGPGYAREDLRAIVHLCAPCSVDQYVQELSLLSRKPGESAVALMVYDPAHLALNLALLERKRPTKELLDAVVAVLLRHPVGAEIALSELIEAAGGSQKSVEAVLRFLADTQVVSLSRDTVRTTASMTELTSAFTDLGLAFESLHRLDPSRAQEVAALSESDGCRAITLARLLGRQGLGGQGLGRRGPGSKIDSAACGMCDVCDPEAKRSYHATRSRLVDPRDPDSGLVQGTEITRRRRSPARGVGTDEEPFPEGDEEEEDFLFEPEFLSGH